MYNDYRFTLDTVNSQRDGPSISGIARGNQGSVECRNSRRWALDLLVYGYRYKRRESANDTTVSRRLLKLYHKQSDQWLDSWSLLALVDSIYKLDTRKTTFVSQFIGLLNWDISFWVLLFSIIFCSTAERDTGGAGALYRADAPAFSTRYQSNYIQ